MRVLVEDYPHQTGEHCASTAIRNILRFHGTEMSEGMVVGLSSGLGFFYIESEGVSPPRMFHGRTAALEQDFCRNTGLAHVNRTGDDDDTAWSDLRRQLEAGRPALLSTDTFYLGYHHTTSHFPGHRVVAVGFDDEADRVYMADRKFDAYQTCTRDELRRSRNAADYPMSCHNEWIEFTGDVALQRPLEDAIREAATRNADAMLNGDASGLPTPGETPGFHLETGIRGMREVAAAAPGWKDHEAWSWISRFAYQVVIKRGAGGSFFRSLYAEFLEEAAATIPKIREQRLDERMRAIAADWRAVAAVFEEQSEREHCAPQLFSDAGQMISALADREESFFVDLKQTLAA